MDNSLVFVKMDSLPLSIEHTGNIRCPVSVGLVTPQ